MDITYHHKEFGNGIQNHSKSVGKVFIEGCRIIQKWRSEELCGSFIQLVKLFCTTNLPEIVTVYICKKKRRRGLNGYLRPRKLKKQERRIVYKIREFKVLFATNMSRSYQSLFPFLDIIMSSFIHINNIF